MGISMAMDLHPTLDAILDDFLFIEEMARVVHQAAELEACTETFIRSVDEGSVSFPSKPTDHWVCYGDHFPFTIHCNLFGKAISPEFDRGTAQGSLQAAWLFGLIREMLKHFIPLPNVFSHSFLWHSHPKVVQSVLLFF